MGKELSRRLLHVAKQFENTHIRGILVMNYSGTSA